MIKIGITGGIGSGKTTVCKVFELLGTPVFYSDAAAKAVMQEDILLIEEMKETFGNDSYLPGGILNRKYIASIVFNDPEELKRLNALVHPAVFRAFDNWSAIQNFPYVIKEAALLFESGSYIDCNHTILVTSPMELRIKRVIGRDRISREEVEQRINKQLSDHEKEKIADLVLKNDESTLLIPEIIKLHLAFSQEKTLPAF